MEFGKRGKSFAKFGKACREFRELIRLLPRESALHAWYRDSKAGWLQHRYKFGVNLTEIDIYAESAEIPIAPCRYLRFINDAKGSEVLGPGAFFGFCELRGRWGIEPGDPRVGFAAALRRTAEQLRSSRTAVRPKNSDRLGIIECVLFDHLWRSEEMQSEFLRTLLAYDDSDDVPEQYQQQFAAKIASEVTLRLDAVDRAVFGTVTPDMHTIFSTMVRFWEQNGLEWLVANDAFEEFSPN